MFETLTARLQQALQKMTGRGTLRERDIAQGMKEVRRALLEADVNFNVARDFVKDVSEQCKGAEILKSLSPGQHVVKVVYDELVHLLGDAAVAIERRGEPPTTILVCGLNGSGKTTFCGKLALYLQKRDAKPLLCAADVYRPAAIEQLEVVGRDAGVPVFAMGQNAPADIVKAALARARAEARDPLIIDTAGRLQIDNEMMAELEELEEVLGDPETLLVVDAMTGQDAVNVAEEFARRLSIDGVILTKLDGDARGGAALSVRAVTGAPIKFVSVGERLEALEPFHPDRMASRILGMGDVLTLVERAQEAMDQEKAQELARKVLEDQFTLEDFRSQLLHVRKMGPLQQLIELIPGLQDTSGMQYVDEDFDEKDMDHMVAVVNSMTMEERLHPSVLTGSRKRRIAKGSGMTVQDVNLVLKQYRQVAQMMKGMLSGEGGPGAVPPTAAKKIRIPARFRH